MDTSEDILDRLNRLCESNDDRREFDTRIFDTRALCRPELDVYGAPTAALIQILVSYESDESILRAAKTLRERLEEAAEELQRERLETLGEKAHEAYLCDQRDWARA